MSFSNKNCFNCIHLALRSDEDPCIACVEYSHWTPVTNTPPADTAKADDAKDRPCYRCKHRDKPGHSNPCRACLAGGDFNGFEQAEPSSDTAKVPGAKNDDGKLDLSAVPPEIITAVAEIRRYGNAKYADPENWRRVEPAKFHKAMLRHILACWQDPFAIDPESGMPHLWHVCCNAAFLCHFYNKEEKTNV